MQSLAIGIPEQPADGAVVVDDQAMTDLAQVPGATEGYTRAWRLKDGTALRITALRADNFQCAITLARASLAASGLGAAEYFADLPSGFLGVSDVAFVVEVSGVTAGKGHQQLIDAIAALEFG